MPFLFIKVLAYFIDVVHIFLQPYAKGLEKAIEPLKIAFFFTLCNKQIQISNIL